MTNDKPSRGGRRKGAGAPQKLEDGKRVNVYLDKRSIEKASKLGDGNVSNGIRNALKDK